MPQGYKAALYFSTNESTYAAETAAGTPAWTEVTKLQDVQPPNPVVDDVETQHLKSPDQFKTFEGGWGDAGEVTAEVQYDAIQYATMLGLLRTPKGWKALFNDDSNGVTGNHDGGSGFDGYVKAVGVPFEAEGLVRFEITIKVSGKPAPIAAVSS